MRLWPLALWVCAWATLWPGVASAEPITAWIAATLITAFGPVAAAWIIFIGKKVFTAIVLSAATTLLVKSTLSKPDSQFPMVDPGRSDTLRQSAAPRATIYGETRVGSTIVYVESTGSSLNGDLSIFCAVAGHEIAGYEEFFFGDEPLVLSSNALQGRFLNRGEIHTHVGSDTQAADATMLAVTRGNWTAAHQLKRIAYYHAYLFWGDGSAWDDFSLQGMRVRVRGKLLYDTRDAGTRFSNNPALAIRDYLVNRMSVTAAEIDDASVTTAANVCEEQVAVVSVGDFFTADADTDVITLDADVRNLRRGCIVIVSSAGTLPAGLSQGVNYYYIPVTKLSGKLATSYANSLTGTAIDITDTGTGSHRVTRESEPRYTISAIVLDTDSPRVVLETMAAAMAGAVAYIGGKWSVFAGEAGTATVTLDEDDLRGPITVNARRPRSSLFNAIKPLFVDPDRFYQQATAAGIRNSTYVDADNGNEIWSDLSLPLTDTDTAAQRLGKIMLERARQQITIGFPAKLSALRLQVWDVVNVTHANFGWSAKKFRVIGFSMSSDEGVDLMLTEEAAAMWAWSAEETATDPAPDTNLPDFRNVGAPGSIIVVEELRVTASGTLVTILTVSVPASNDALTRRYDWQWKVATDTDYSTLPDSRSGLVEIPNVIDGTLYDIRVRGVNALGYLSSYSATTYTPLGWSGPPADVTNFHVNIRGPEAFLTWTAVTDLDLSHYHLKHSKQTSGVTWGNSIDLVDKIPRPATSIVVPAMTGTWIIKAVDLKGNESVNAITIAATITAIPHLNLQQTIAEDPTFGGTHSDTWANVDGKLQLHTENDTLAAWSAMSTVDAMAMGEDGTATVKTPGTYTFASSVDQGVVTVSRITDQTEAAGYNYRHLMKNWPTMAGVQRMDGGVTSAWDVTLQFRETTDDPTGSPTWGSWRDFVAADVRAWGIEFRARLESSFGNVTPLVSELQVRVDLPDRIEKAADVAINAAGTAITYGTTFISGSSRITINIAAQNLQQGDYYTIASKTNSGFTIRFFNSADVGVARTVDWSAHGH